MHNQPRELQTYEDCQAKSIQEFGGTSQGMDWGWGQGIKSHHTQTCQGIWLYSCRLRRLTWAKQKMNWTVAQWSKVLFSDESKFSISFGNQGPSMHPVYQDILEHFILPSADQLFKDADFIFQKDLSPAHTAKSTKSWLIDYDVGVLDWPANSPDLNPRESMEYCQEEN